MSSPCQLKALPGQDWNRSHISWDGGRNGGFVRASGPVSMRLWDDRDLPFTYSLARHFPLGQRYFCSVLAQTYPNRRFFFTATASGTIATDSTTFEIPAANDTIWDRLDAHDIDWAIYFQNLPSWVIVPGSLIPARGARQRPSSPFLGEVAAGKLPQFTFLDPDYNTTSEENPQDIEVGERFIAQVVDALIPRADLAQDGALHHLRRAWRLLRPRAAAARDQARFDPTDAQPGRRPRR